MDIPEAPAPDVEPDALQPSEAVAPEVEPEAPQPADAIAPEVDAEAPQPAEAADGDRSNDLSRLLRDNTVILSALRQNAGQDRDWHEVMDAQIGHRLEQVQQAMQTETSPAKLRKLEAAYVNLCRRRGKATQGYALADLLDRHIPLADLPPEEDEEDENGEPAPPETEQAPDDGTVPDEGNMPQVPQ